MKRILAIFAFLLLLTPYRTANAVLDGPTGCKAGELAVIRSDVEAVWAVYPATYSASFAVADGGKTCFFASPISGEATIIAASVSDNGKPVIDAHTLHNGYVPTPPSPPVPTPEPNAETLESVIKTESNGKDAAVLTALADSFEYVVDGIDRRTITTPAGARETFRRIWMEKGTAVKLTAIHDLSALISAISSHVDNSSLENLRGDYARSAMALRESIASKTPKICPNGTCNQNQNRWRVR